MFKTFLKGRNTNACQGLEQERSTGVKNKLQYAPILTFGRLSIHAD